VQVRLVACCPIGTPDVLKHSGFGPIIIHPLPGCVTPGHNFKPLTFVYMSCPALHTPRLRDSWRAAHLSPEELEQMVGAQVQGQALGPPLPAPDGLLQPTAFSSVPQTTAALAAVMAPSAVSMQPSLLTRPATGNQPSLTHYQSLNHHHLNNSLGHSNILRASAGEGGTMFNSAGVGNSLSGQAASGSGIVQPVPLNPTVARVGSIEFSDASFFWLERHLRSNKLRLSVTEQLGKVRLCQRTHHNGQHGSLQSLPYITCQCGTAVHKSGNKLGA
jgi:hypothetical protein